MDWKYWVDEGYVWSRPGSKVQTMPTILLAWERVVDARKAYLAAEWVTADEHLRRAFCTATKALLRYYNYETVSGCDFEMAERIGEQYFGETVAKPIFDKARILRSMMPTSKVIDEEEAREVRRSVAAASQYVALVECFVYK